MNHIQQGQHYKTHEPLLTIFKKQQQDLLPLKPSHKWRKWTNCRVNHCQLIQIQHHCYSVSEKFVGTRVDVSLTLFKVEILKDGEIIAIHTRQFDGQDSLQLDHYLDQLHLKPAALKDCKAIKHHHFPWQLQEIWKQLQQRYPLTEANQQFVNILLLGRRHSQLLEAIDLALQCGAVDYFAIAHLATQLEHPQPVRKTLPILGAQSWTFDLSMYRELCEVIS